jgi:hypothetical protein
MMDFRIKYHRLPILFTYILLPHLSSQLFFVSVGAGLAPARFAFTRNSGTRKGCPYNYKNIAYIFLPHLSSPLFFGSVGAGLAPARFAFIRNSGTRKGSPYNYNTFIKNIKFKRLLKTFYYTFLT